MQIEKKVDPLNTHPVEANNYIDSNLIHSHREKSANLKTNIQSNTMSIIIKTKSSFLMIFCIGAQNIEFIACIFYVGV